MDYCWLAGFIDATGTIGIRLGEKQFQPYIAIFSNRKDRLEELKVLFPRFSIPYYISRRTYMSQIVSIQGVYETLDGILPFLRILRNIGEKVLELCRSRLNHGEYSIRELQLVREIISLSDYQGSVSKRIETLEKYLGDR